MKVRITFWTGEVGSEMGELEVQLKPFGYRMVPVTQWKVLIANEDMEVRKGEPVILGVKPVIIPGNTMVGPLHIMRHALGTVLDVVECGIPTKVEEEKCVNKVLFLPVDDGKIEKGDLVGVLKVFFIKTGLLNRLFNIKPQKIELSEEIVEANIVWRDNGNIYREKIKTEVFGYTRTHIGIWEMLVANEDVNVRAGEVVRIGVEELNLPPNTVVVPLPINRNPYGSVVDVVQLGKPAKVEEKKKIQQAVFLAVEDGKIQKGDLIGIVNVYYVGVKDFKTVIAEDEREVNIVYRSGGGVVRKRVTVDPYGYKRSPIARWELLVADRDIEVKKGEVAVIDVEKVKIPPNTIIYPLQIMRHALGTFVDVYCDCPPWKVEEGGMIRKVLFLPIADGTVRKGDLVGIINLYSVELGPIDKIREMYARWIQMSEEELMAYVEGLQ